MVGTKQLVTLLDDNLLHPNIALGEVLIHRSGTESLLLLSEAITAAPAQDKQSSCIQSKLHRRSRGIVVADKLLILHMHNTNTSSACCNLVSMRSVANKHTIIIIIGI